MKKFIIALAIGLPVVYFVSQQQERVPQPQAQAPIEKASVDEPILFNREFPYSVVRSGVHNADEAQHATGDEVVKLHYAGIDTGRLEATAYKTDAARYVSYRVSDQIFWTAKPVTIKAGEAVLCDGKNFIRARCGNRISEHPMQPTRRTEPSERELDNPVAGVAYWVHLRAAGDFQQVEGPVLQRGRGRDHPAGFLAHLNRVQGHGAEIL